MMKSRRPKWPRKIERGTIYMPEPGDIVFFELPEDIYGDEFGEVQDGLQKALGPSVKVQCLSGIKFGGVLRLPELTEEQVAEFKAKWQAETANKRPIPSASN